MPIRIVESEWAPFVEQLCARRDVETAGVILAERLEGGTLFARQCVVIPDDGYQIRKVDQVRIDPVAFNRAIRPARDGGLSVITVHTHPSSDRPWFSAADDRGDAVLMPSLFTQMPGPHGSVVVAGNSRMPTARVWADGGGVPTGATLRVVGQLLRTYMPEASMSANVAFFDRQTLALGEDGRRALQALHVAVVGLGGTGSAAFAQLAHLGVGTITVVDADRVEASNVSRIIGARRSDIGRTWKADVAQRYADDLNLGTHVNVLREHLGYGISVSQIEDADVLLSCVDRHTPRALLNRLSYQRGVPLIDMGSAFRLGAEGQIVSGVGRVVVVGPQRRCLACWGHIDPNRLRTEALSSAERARAVVEGYIEGADVDQPSVVAFNTAIAGAAVIELMRMATAFAGAEAPPQRLSFDFETGTVRRNSLNATRSCSICMTEPAPRVPRVEN